SSADTTKRPLSVPDAVSGPDTSPTRRRWLHEPIDASNWAWGVAVGSLRWSLTVALGLPMPPNNESDPRKTSRPSYSERSSDVTPTPPRLTLVGAPPSI